MKFSKNGKYLASAGQDTAVRVWEVCLKRGETENAEEEARGTTNGDSGLQCFPLISKFACIQLSGTLPHQAVSSSSGIIACNVSLQWCYRVANRFHCRNLRSAIISLKNLRSIQCLYQCICVLSLEFMKEVCTRQAWLDACGCQQILE